MAATTVPIESAAPRRASPVLAVARRTASRLGLAVVTLLGVSMIVHWLFSLVPGGPAAALLGEQATPEAVAALNERYGLDAPVWERYLTWVRGLLSGDFGTSYRTNRPVLELIAERLPVTIELAVLATVIALLVCVPVAILCVRRPGGVIDRAVTALATAAISIPGFIVALLLVYVFSTRLELLPPLGWTPLTENPLENLKFAVLPVMALAIQETAEYVRVLRADMLTTMSDDFVTAARSTGLPPAKIMARYVLRPSSFTLTTLSGLNFGRLLGGTVIAEAIFSLSGLGSLVVTGISSRDLPLLQGVLIFIAAVFVVVNLLVDVLYSFIDPRVRTAATD